MSLVFVLNAEVWIPSYMNSCPFSEVLVLPAPPTVPQGVSLDVFVNVPYSEKK